MKHSAAELHIETPTLYFVELSETFCLSRPSEFAMIVHSTPVLLFTPTASHNSVTSLFCKACGSKESIRKSLCTKANVVDGVSQIELVLYWNQFSVFIPCHCMRFLGCRAELNIVFSEVTTEAAREWAISLYLRQSHESPGSADKHDIMQHRWQIHFYCVPEHLNYQRMYQIPKKEQANTTQSTNSKLVKKLTILPCLSFVFNRTNIWNFFQMYLLHQEKSNEELIFIVFYF